MTDETGGAAIGAVEEPLPAAEDATLRTSDAATIDALNRRERALVRKALSRYADELDKELKRLGEEGLQLDDAYADVRAHRDAVIGLRSRFADQRELPLDGNGQPAPTPLERAIQEAETPENLHSVLLLVEHQVDPEVIGSWTEEQRQQAWDWAGAMHLYASDNDVELPTYPDFLEPFRLDGQEGPDLEATSPPRRRPRRGRRKGRDQTP